MVSRIQGHKNPFADHLLALNEAQLDFILEMESIDNPERMTFTRGDAPPVTDVRAAWADVLRGRAKQDYYGESLLGAIHRSMRKRPVAPKLGFVRGKKP